MSIFAISHTNNERKETEQTAYSTLPKNGTVQKNPTINLHQEL